MAGLIDTEELLKRFPALNSKRGKKKTYRLEWLTRSRQIPIVRIGRRNYFDPDEIEFLIEDLLPAACLLVLAGKPKLGKSLLSLLFAISIGLGKSLWNKKVTQGGVLFISTEDGEIRLKKRIWKMLGDPDKYNPNFHFYIGECILTDQKILEALKARIHQIHPRLVVLDPLINLFKGRELNSGEDMNEVLRSLQNLCKEIGTTILVIHHARKSGGDDPLDVVQGSITIAGVADGILILKNLKGDVDEKRATLEVILKDAELPKTTVLKLDENLKWEVEGELQEIYGRNIEDEVVKALYEDNGLTIQNLIQITGYEYKPLYRALLKLEEADKVSFEKKGKSHIKVYSLESEWKTKMESEKRDTTNGKYSNNYTPNPSFSKTAISGNRSDRMESESPAHSETCDCDECLNRNADPWGSEARK